MTRQKKSRKPGLQQKTNKSSKDNTFAKEQRIPKKPKGNKPGTRQQVENKKKKVYDKKPAKDPRLGSKKPIDLTPQAAPIVEQKKKKPKQIKEAGIAPIHVVDNSAQLMAELEAIEADAYLEELVEKQEADQPLTPEEIDYLTEKLDRHDELLRALGIDEVDDEEESEQPLSDDDLWDKFDSTDFSNYEQD